MIDRRGRAGTIRCTKVVSAIDSDLRSKSRVFAHELLVSLRQEPDGCALAIDDGVDLGGWRSCREPRPLGLRRVVVRLSLLQLK